MTVIEYAYATLHAQTGPNCIHKIRSFLVLSNLGCEGVNRDARRIQARSDSASASTDRMRGKHGLDRKGEDPANEHGEEILITFSSEVGRVKKTGQAGI